MRVCSHGDYIFPPLGHWHPWCDIPLSHSVHGWLLTNTLWTVTVGIPHLSPPCKLKLRPACWVAVSGLAEIWTWLRIPTLKAAYLKLPIFVCCSFASLQHLRSNRDRYRLVSVCSDGAIIVLPHWEIKQQTPWPDIPTQSHYPDTKNNQSLPYSIDVDLSLESDKYQFCNSLVWLARKSNARPSALEVCTLSIQPLRPVNHQYLGSALTVYAQGRFNRLFNTILCCISSYRILCMYVMILYYFG